MGEPEARSITAGRFECRVWEKGHGEPLGFLGGLYGLPRWTPFLDRLAARRRVVAPSLPGFPGARGRHELDDFADWVTATLDVLEAAGLEGADLVGASLGATLAAEAAAFCPTLPRRLVLVAPFGLFDADEPAVDLWARNPDELPGLLSAEPERLAAALAAPDTADLADWESMLERAVAASARLLRPLGEAGLARRLHRIRAASLIVWGSRDRVLPASYAKHFAAGISGWVEVREIAEAGHTAEIDRPHEVADAVLAFLD